MPKDTAGKAQADAESGKPIQVTGGFPKADGIGDARRNSVDSIAAGAIRQINSNPLTYHTNKSDADNSMMYQCPQGNPEDPAFKRGRHMEGA